MNTNELLVLAHVIAERAVRYEGLLLGLFLRDVLPELELSMLTGERLQAAKEWCSARSYDDLWSSPRIRTVAYRAVKHSELFENDVTEALHLMALREDADAVLAQLFALEVSCSRLERRRRALLREEIAPLVASSGTEGTPSSPVASDSEDDATGTPREEATSSVNASPCAQEHDGCPPDESDRLDAAHMYG